MSRILNIMNRFFNESFKISVEIPPYDKLFGTVLIPSVNNNRILDYKISLSKIIENKEVVYNLVIYRDCYDVATFTVYLDIVVDNNRVSFVDYPFSQFQLSDLINWLQDNSSKDSYQGIFNLILDDGVEFIKSDSGFMVNYLKHVSNVDSKYLIMSEEDFKNYLDNLLILYSKMGANPSVYQSVRQYVK